MKTYELTEKEYYNIHRDYRSIYNNSQNIPELEKYKGKRTMLVNENGITTLLIEDINFKLLNN